MGVTGGSWTPQGCADGLEVPLLTAISYSWPEEGVSVLWGAGRFGRVIVVDRGGESMVARVESKLGGGVWLELRGSPRPSRGARAVWTAEREEEDILEGGY